ncbi:protein claret segregational [Fopius arisanus]|uniref:Ncd protein n=1 Tax=Fopius arisanus TaxID=64838 RepID=A0A0C9QWK4_9HYME|nr:PREDICTED: protein claret segregational [Fopius arisanus]
MESRLPKPKINLSKSVMNSEQISKVSSLKPSTAGLPSHSVSTSDISKDPNFKVPKEVPSTRPNTTLRTLGKQKTTMGLTKITNENKPPIKSSLRRSRTLGTITRATTAVKAGVKRPGTLMSTIESKRPNIRPLPKTGPSSIASTSAVSGKSLRPVTTAKTAPKPSKWDWKGKYGLAAEELTSLKEKLKNVSEENEELKSITDDLKERESKSSIKAQQLEEANEELSKELSETKRNATELETKSEKLEFDLHKCQENYKNVSESLKDCRETCRTMEQTLASHSSELKRVQSDLSMKIQTIGELSDRVKELQEVLHQMDKDRRVLHNYIQEMKGNIRVFCRVRPRISKESNKNLCSINYVDECTIEIGRADGSDSLSCSGKSRGTKQEFSFDKIFPPNASQATVFEELSLLVQSALEGYNVCVFAYGQTGSGKTYTMEGGCNAEMEGMIPRTVRHIFEEMKEFKLLGWQYKIEASFLEIYNEHIVDLLDANQKTHEIRMVDNKGTDLYVTNLQVEEINSPQELHECLRTAQQNRAVAATTANERSSRSHSVARIRLIGTHAEKEEICIGNLNLVDLAGSERLKNEEAARTAETKNINKSLANLGNVILALLRKQEHIPYRNSKLTHLLMPSLGGNSKTLMLLNISPLDECYNETLNSLRFASNVNNCKLGNVKRSKTFMQTSGN